MSLKPEDLILYIICAMFWHTFGYHVAVFIMRKNDSFDTAVERIQHPCLLSVTDFDGCVGGWGFIFILQGKVSRWVRSLG